MEWHTQALIFNWVLLLLVSIYDRNSSCNFEEGWRGEVCGYWVLLSFIAVFAWLIFNIFNFLNGGDL